MHKLQVPHIFGETPPPPSTAGEDVVTSSLDIFPNTCGLVVTFFYALVVLLCQLAFGALIYVGYTAAGACSTNLSDEELHRNWLICVHEAF